VDDFVQEAEQFDDLTMLCLEYRGPQTENPKYELEVAAEIEKLPEVLSFLEGHLEEAGCPPKAQMQLAVAAEEIFTNIANYAYAPQTGSAVVCLEISREPSAAIVTFVDSGVPFDPLAKADPDVTLPAEERGIGGLGILMAKKTMDDVKYEYRDGKNVLRLEKKL